jgi:hypothetical protein
MSSTQDGICRHRAWKSAAGKQDGVYGTQQRQFTNQQGCIPVLFPEGKR